MCLCVICDLRFVACGMYIITSTLCFLVTVSQLPNVKCHLRTKSVVLGKTKRTYIYIYIYIYDIYIIFCIYFFSPGA